MDLTKGDLPVDLAAAKLKVKELERYTKPLSTDCVWAIVYGRFETYAELRTATAGDGRTVYGIGFGHLNEAPAQVIHKSKDVLFVSNK